MLYFNIGIFRVEPNLIHSAYKVSHGKIWRFNYLELYFLNLNFSK